jgi:SSS family solute:Na+ symporter
LEFPVLAFFLISAAIGVHTAVRIRGKVKNFYVGGNVLPPWIVCISLVGAATDVNAKYAFGASFWDGALIPICIGTSLILIGLFFAAPLHRMRLLTLPDFYFLRFDKRVELLVSIITVLCVGMLTASNLAGVGIILNRSIGIDPAWAMTGVITVITIYTMAGGLFAVTWTDVLQVAVGVLGVVGVFIYFYGYYQSDFMHAAVVSSFSWEPLLSFQAGALNKWALICSIALGAVVSLDFMERVFASKTARQAQIACVFSGIVTIVLGVMLTVIVLVATRLYTPADGDAEPFYSSIKAILPDGLSMILFLALMAINIATIAGLLMACITVITKNIVQQNAPKLIPRERLLLCSRLAALPVAILALLIAIYKPEQGALLAISLDLLLAGCLVPLVLGIYWKRGNARAAFWAIVIPSALRVLLYFTLPADLQGVGTLIPPVVSLLVYVGIALRQPLPIGKEPHHAVRAG